MAKFSSTLVCCVGIGVSFCAIAFPSSAQKPSAAPPVPSASGPVAQFQKAINDIAEKNNTVIVAEGAPLAFDASVLKDSFYTAAPLAKKVSIVADTADYDVKNQHGVFLLTKRYSNPGDLPCVTLSECRTSLKNVSKILAQLAPPPQAQTNNPYDFRILDFFRSLSPEQVEAMRQRPLPSAQFSALQKDKATAMLASTYLDRILNSADYTLTALNELPDVWLRYEMFNYANVLVWAEKKRPDVTHALLGGNQLRFAKTAPVNNKALPDPAPTTLGAELSRLNERQTPKDAIPAVSYEAGADYAEKPLTVAGMEKLEPERAAAALVSVYDLRLRTVASVRNVISRPLLASVSIFNVGDAIAAALPAPLTRVLRGETRDKYLPQEQRESIRGGSEGFAKQQIIGLYADAAVQRLRQKYEHEIIAAGKKGVFVAEWDATDRRAITVAEMTRFLESAATILNDPAPVYISRFEQLAVSGNRYISPEDKKPKIQLDLLVPSPAQDGSYRVVAGYGNVADTPAP